MVNCNNQVNDLEFDIPITTITIKGNCECGSILQYDCNGQASCLDVCDLESKLESCRACTDLFDLCCMPECKNGTYIRINDCNDCANKYELVDACTIWTEIMQSEKCGFDIELDCATLEQLVTVCPTLANPTIEGLEGFSWKCNNGKLELCGALPEAFTCEKLCECIGISTFDCNQQSCKEILDDISCSLDGEDCPVCENCDEDECEYFGIEYCPETCDIRQTQNPHKVKCYRNARVKAELSGGPLHIQQTSGEDKIYYLSSVALPVETIEGSPISRAADNAVLGDKDTVAPCRDHCVKNSAYSGNGYIQYISAGTEYTHFEFQVDINKSIHALRMGLMKIPCGEVDGKIIAQFKMGATVGDFYKLPDGCTIPPEVLCAHSGSVACTGYGQPRTPDLFYGPTACNNLPTAFQGPITNTEVAGTFSMGRYLEALSFNGGTQVDVKPGDIIVPVLFVSASTTGDCDAENNPYGGIVSILGKGSNQGGGKFSSHFGSYGITDIYEKKCLVDEFGCKCSTVGLGTGGVFDCKVLVDCTCGTIQQPEKVCFEPGEAFELEIEEECEFNSQEDCPEGTFFVKLNPNECGYCTANPLDPTGGSCGGDGEGPCGEEGNLFCNEGFVLNEETGLCEPE